MPAGVRRHVAELDIASDGTRCVCVYEADNAEAVRRANRSAGVGFENVWAASPMHRTDPAG